MNALDFLICLGFLTTAFTWRGILPVDLRFYYSIILLLVLIYLPFGELVVSKRFLSLLFAIAALSILSIFLGKTTILSVFSQVVGVGVLSIVLFSYFRTRQNKILRKITYYFNIAFYISIIAICQEISFLLGFEKGYAFSYFLPGVGPVTTEGILLRVNSVFTEPAYLAMALIPAVYIAVQNIFLGKHLFLSKVKSAIILLALLLTFSSLGYIGLIACFLLSIDKKRKKQLLRILCLVIIFSYVAIICSTNLQARLTTLANLLPFRKLSNEGNVSSLILYTNYLVAKKSFLSNPLWGSGLGSHPFTYAKYLPNLKETPGLGFLSFMNPNDLGMKDAMSLFLRLLSETGLLGLGAFLYFMMANRVKKKIEPYHSLSKMCVVFFLIYGIRNGQYVRFELWYFIAFYYYLKKAFDHHVREPLMLL